MIFNIDFIFKLLNFFVLVSGVLYCIRYYGIVNIVRLMRLEDQKKEDMESLYKDIQDKTDQINDTIKEQEKSYGSMKDTFEIWQKEVEKDALAHQKVFQQRQKDFEHKQMVVLRNVQRQEVFRRELPKILDEVSKDIQVEFANNHKQQKQYTGQLIAFMKEESK